MHMLLVCASVAVQVAAVMATATAAAPPTGKPHILHVIIDE